MDRRFTKQGFDLEGVQARRFTTLQNPVALASLAGALTIFPFHSLLAGWQHLFSAARVIFHPWLRRRRHSGATAPPPQPDLFADAPGLLWAMR